uniref:Uncharacterized protein n=1 Tax=Arundo donax TaxID=35708 RepID=A0A0A9AC84_ARUDO
MIRCEVQLRYEHCYCNIFFVR